MNYLQQLYLEKKNKAEQEAKRNLNNAGVEARFVANKIIKFYFDNHYEEIFPMSINRLSRLVQLVDIIYFKENKGLYLVRDGYKITENGLIRPEIYYHYNYLIQYNSNKYFEAKEELYQEMSEKLVDSILSAKIDLIVARVVENTKYVDTLDLRDMLNNEEIQFIKCRFEYSDTNYVPQEIVKILYKNFDFSKFEELNEIEKKKIGSLG